MMPVSGPICFDISLHAKNYSLLQSTLVQKYTLSSCTRGERGDGGEDEVIPAGAVQLSLFRDVRERMDPFKVGFNRK